MEEKAILIDTGSASAFVALSKGGVVIHAFSFPQGRSLSQQLLPKIQSICQENSLDYVALGIGPGSFTGTRMGAMVAKTLSFSLEIPLISFSSLLLPNLEEIAAVSYQKFKNNEFETQIELVYFSETP